MLYNALFGVIACVHWRPGSDPPAIDVVIDAREDGIPGAGSTFGIHWLVWQVLSNDLKGWLGPEFAGLPQDVTVVYAQLLQCLHHGYPLHYCCQGHRAFSVSGCDRSGIHDLESRLLFPAQSTAGICTADLLAAFKLSC